MSSSKAATSRLTSAALEPEGNALAATTSSMAMTTRIGQLVEQRTDGSFVVDYPGNVFGPMPARAVASCADALALTRGTERDVLLVFDAGDPKAPVIIGTLVESRVPVVKVISVGGQPSQVGLEGDTLVLRADRSIRIECGQASLALHADGSIVVKGRKILSRASESNRIKGATVAIN